MSKNKFKEWFNQKYKLIFRKSTYKVLWQIELQNWKIILFFFIISLIFFAISYLIIAITPIESTLPNFPTAEMVKKIHENYITTDSLLQEIEKRDKYLKMMQDFIYDEIPIDEKYVVDPSSLTAEQIEKFNDPTVKRKEAKIPTIKVKKDDIQNLFVPIKGIIINHFDINNNHLGIDIASKARTNVSATLSGTVLLADYSVKYGYTIIIQHRQNLVSVYKHCASLLVTQGELVESGQVIAIYGTTGEESTGRHLHFELWKNGYVVNPEDYIIF